MPEEPSASPVPVEHTACCVVGAGPAGMTLAYLLARDGVEVTLLESHADFARDFRGDTFHASSIELIEDLGLLEKLEPLIQARLARLRFTAEDGSVATMASFERMKSRHPYVAIVPQADFLTMMAREGARFPSFRLLMQAGAQELVEEDGRVAGVRYQMNGKVRELRTRLVIGADGRGSLMRRCAKLDLVTQAPPMDVVWFRLPRHLEDSGTDEGVEIRVERGTMLVRIARGDAWQCGYIIVKGSLNDLKRAGIQEFQNKIRALVPPFLQARVAPALDDWKNISVLAVQVGRVLTWHRPGLLLIGDAAHVMSPIGGVGINYAIQDAVAAHRILSDPLKAGTLQETDLAAVQKRREWPTRVMQAIQTVVQKHIVRQALKSGKSFRFPLPMRIVAAIPLMRRMQARLFAYGVRPERLENPK